MKILIIGGTRYLGPRLVKTLLDAGHEPVLFNRGQTRAPLPVSSPVRQIHGDRNRPGALRSIVEGETFDAVVDTLAFNGPDAELAVSELSGRVGRYLVISSVACYGRLTYAPANEQHPYTTDETAFPGGGNDYASGKRDVEKVLLAACRTSGFPVIVIRPSVSYGYGRLFSIWGYSNRHIARIRAGKPVIVPDTGEGLIQPVFIDDEATVIERALTNDAAIGEVFNCAGPVAVPLWEYFRCTGRALGQPVQCVEIPAKLLEGFDPVLCVRASQNLIFNHAYDVSKLKRVLGFEHAYSLEEGLRATVEFQDQWNLIEPTCKTDPDDWLIEAFRSCPEANLRALGEQTRLERSYQPPQGQPLVTWAPRQATV